MAHYVYITLETYKQKEVCEYGRLLICVDFNVHLFT